MNERSDVQLLRDYAEGGDEAAFREVVVRHTDFVYSSALRQVNSPAIAGDIAQGVFTDLARKARPLAATQPAGSSLAGWLHRGIRYAALKHLRDDHRRIAHERQAMEQLLTNSESPPSNWERIRPVLDEALDSLGDEDREALCLRYFKNRDFRAVGLALGVSDDAAQKRVSRAVERLREFFARRGVTVGAGALAALVSANAIQAAPAGLAAAISTAAILAGSTVSTSIALATTKTIAMATIQKALMAATLAAVAGAGIYEARQATRLREENQALQRQPEPSNAQTEQLQRDRDRLAAELAALRDENARLARNAADLPKLRSEVTRLRDESNDPTAIAAQALVRRVNLLKQRLDQWPKKTPELQLLKEQDWLDEAGKRQLDTDDDCRAAMGELRTLAKQRFAMIVKDALEQFFAANNNQYPSDPSQLLPYLKPPADSILATYDIAPPNTLHVPQPNASGSENAETWGMIKKGDVNSAGGFISDGSNIADQDYDMYVIIYKGGWYAFNPPKSSK